MNNQLVQVMLDVHTVTQDLICPVRVTVIQCLPNNISCFKLKAFYTSVDAFTVKHLQEVVVETQMELLPSALALSL